MAVAYVESICGYPYMQKERIAQEFDISPNTVRNRLHEIEESLDKAAAEAIRSRDYVAQYCNETDCIKCCFGDGNGGCSLISGPPCMWTKRTEEVIKY